MNSSTEESRFLKRLVWLEAIFLNKNGPTFYVLFVSQEERRASDTVFVY